MADKVEQYLKCGNVYVTIEVIAEVVYVLKGIYLLERGKIAEVITDFIGLVDCQERNVINLGTLKTYARLYQN